MDHNITDHNITGELTDELTDELNIAIAQLKVVVDERKSLSERVQNLQSMVDTMAKNEEANRVVDKIRCRRNAFITIVTSAVFLALFAVV